MSIEQQLQDLTTAVKNLTLVIAEVSKPGSTKPAVEPAKAEVKKPDPKPEKAAAAASAAPPADTPATQEPTAVASRELDYDRDVKPAFLKLVQSKGRASGRKIIDAFAPTKEKLSEAITTQEQYKQALALIAKEAA
jgi:hypothetical protein